MHKSIIGALLGVSVIAVSFATATPAQAQNRWRNRNTSNGTFYLGVAGGAQCSNYFCFTGVPLVVWPGNGAIDQIWKEPAGYPGTGVIQNAARDYFGKNVCIGVQGGQNAGDGANLIIWNCDTNKYPDQVWDIVPAANFSAPYDDCFVISNPLTGRVMGVADQNVKAGTKVIQWPLYKGKDNIDEGWHRDQFWCPE